MTFFAPVPAIVDGVKTARHVITLDGPAASGKSSVARLVAEALGAPYVSSGLLYRAATYLAGSRGVSLTDETALTGLLNRLQVRLEARVGSPNRVLVEGSALEAGLLQSDSVDAGVSAVARLPQVRAWVDARLRELEGTFVVEGRDMGTAVFPDAAHKFYLDAPAEVRAARRTGERAADLPGVAAALRRRDALDAAQLRPAPDAQHIDTGGLSLGGVVAEILRALGELR